MRPNLGSRYVRIPLIGLLATAISFAIMFLLGLGLAAADPHGWAAWRVGLTFGCIVAGICLIGTVLATVIE